MAVAVPLRAAGTGGWQAVDAAVVTSLSQPVGAVATCVFVREARAFLPTGFGLAAGAMAFLVATEVLPEGLAAGADLPCRGRPELLAGMLAGVAAAAAPLLFV